jgi:hypothetical protein
MNLAKKILLLVAFTFSSFIYSQETEKVEKIKIGKYNYETYYKNFNHYEVNEKGYSLFFKKGNKEQSICACIYYKNDNILSLGDVIIDKERGLITCVVKTIVKRVDFASDSIKYIKKQNKRGFFEPVFTVEYRNGKELILYKK